METRDQWYKPNLLYNIHHRPPKKVEPPKMIVETARFNPSFCTCGEHGCEPRYRMERRVLWTYKEIVPNEGKQNTKEVHQVKYAKELQETSEKGKTIEGADKKCEDHIRRNKEDEDVKDGEKADHDKRCMEDYNDDNFEGCVASLVDFVKSDGGNSIGNIESYIDDNGEKGKNGDFDSDGKSLKDDINCFYRRLREDSGCDEATFAGMIYDRDKSNNDIEANYTNSEGSGTNKNYYRDIEGNKDSLVTRKNYYSGVINGGELDVAADDICKNGDAEDADSKYFNVKDNSDDDACATDIEIESSSDDAAIRNDESDGEIVSCEVGTDNETGEQTIQSDGWNIQDDEISPAFGIMSVYCNSELHFWKMV